MQLIPEMIYRETIVGPWGPMTGSRHGERLCWQVSAATITGPRIDLTLAMPGADWLRVDADGVRRPDQRLAFTTAGGAVVLLRYDVAIIRESQTFLSALKSGQETRFEDQYMRMSPQFETGDRELSWLTDTLWLAEGRLAGEHQIEYQIYRVE